MEWWIAYLASVIVVPTIYMAVKAELTSEKFEVTNAGDFLICGIACLIWPITFSIDGYSHISAFVKERRKTKIQEISAKIYDDRHDRTFMIDLAESDLKYIARMYRRGKTRLSASQFEMIREELAQRSMERTLFR